ncbi:MAG: hypothetical protein E7168_05475 [Firmicutes bacterium]|nr:hypothetical protein [Bacillota bacterium]
MNKLENLTFFVDVNENGNMVDRVFCYYKDGKPICIEAKDLPRYEDFASYEEYMNEVLKELSNKTNSNLKDFSEIDKNGRLSVFDKESTDKLSDEIKIFANATEKYEQKLSDQEQNAEKKETFKEKAKRTIAGVTAIAVLGLTAVGIYKLAKKSLGSGQTISTSQIDINNVNNFTNIEAYLKTLGDSSIQKQTITKMLDYAKSSNDSADVVLARLLVMNDFTDSELVEMFGDYEDLNKDNKLVDALKAASLKDVETLLLSKEIGNVDDLILSEEGKAFYNEYLENYRSLVKSYGTNDFKTHRDNMRNRVMKDFNVSALLSETTTAGFDYNSRTLPDYYASVVPIISASEVITADMGMKILTDEEHTAVDYSNICNLAVVKFDDINETLTAYRMAKLATNSEATISDSSISLKKEVSFDEVYELFANEIEKLRSEDNLAIIRENFMQEMTDRKNNSMKNNVNYTNGHSSLGGVTSGSTSGIISDDWMGSLSDEAQDDIQNQIDAIDKEFEEMTNQEKEELLEEKEKIEKESQEQLDKIQEEVEKENAWMEEDANKKPNNDVSSPSYSRPTIDDVNDNIIIDDEYINDDGTLGFDGPIYDEDGNIIDVPVSYSSMTKEEREQVADQIINEMANSSLEIETNSKTK